MKKRVIHSIDDFKRWQRDISTHFEKAHFKTVDVRFECSEEGIIQPSIFPCVVVWLVEKFYPTDIDELDVYVGYTFVYKNDFE